jgi:seryl-tRNA synthetase
MLDIKLLRKDPQALEAKLKTKDSAVQVGPLITLDERIRHVIGELEQLQAKRNALSKEIGEKKRKGEETAELMQDVAGLGDQITALNHERTELETKLTQMLASLPNIPSDEAKVSLDPKDNVCIKTWGQKREFDFAFKNHVELNEKLKLFDFKRAAKTSGSGWPAYCNMGARLEWALINFMIDTHIDNGFEMWMPPHLIRPETMFASGQLPKFEHQLFKIKDDDYNLYLIPTSETVLSGLHIDEIFSEAELPKRYVAYTPCFRREAGAAGSQERGLIRMHQFNKVEMFAFTKPDQRRSDVPANGQQRGRDLARPQYPLPEYALGHRRYVICCDETIDVEVWLPGQNRYYEVSSISNCGDFQSRRSMTRYKTGEAKPEFVYT